MNKSGEFACTERNRAKWRPVFRDQNTPIDCIQGLDIPPPVAEGRLLEWPPVLALPVLQTSPGWTVAGSSIDPTARLLPEIMSISVR